MKKLSMLVLAIGMRFPSTSSSVKGSDQNNVATLIPLGKDAIAKFTVINPPPLSVGVSTTSIIKLLFAILSRVFRPAPIDRTIRHLQS